MRTAPTAASYSRPKPGVYREVKRLPLWDTFAGHTVKEPRTEKRCKYHEIVIVLYQCLQNTSPRFVFGLLTGDLAIFFSSSAIFRNLLHKAYLPCCRRVLDTLACPASDLGVTVSTMLLLIHLATIIGLSRLLTYTVCSCSIIIPFSHDQPSHHPSKKINKLISTFSIPQHICTHSK